LLCADASCETLEDIGGTATDEQGTFVIEVDHSQAGDVRLIVAADFEVGSLLAGAGAQAGTTYRVIAFGRLSGDNVVVALGPATEAATRLLEANGLANYSDSRITGVNEAVADANAATSFAGVTLEEAVQRAQDNAIAGPSVTARLGCPVDCNLNRIVTVEELIISIRRVLGLSPEEICEAADGNGDGISIDELVDGVSRAINGCFK
jgi:hypothetical protein